METMEIHTRKDLKTFRDRVNNGEYDLNAELIADIDLSGITWTPIGWHSDGWKGYSGHFNGNGHIISGISMKYKSLNYNIGFFSHIIHGSVKNLTVEGVAQGIDAAGIAGVLEKWGTIENCVNKIKCCGSYHVAGICAVCTQSIIKSCVNYADLEGFSPAGIVGNYNLNEPNENETEVINCRNEGSLFIQAQNKIQTIRENNFEYNQIGGRCNPGTNQQNGKVILPFQRSLLGMYLRNDTFTNWSIFRKDYVDFLAADKNTLHKDKAGNTYLHLLCQNHVFHYYRGKPSVLNDLIMLLATETKIDFAAKNNDGKTAADYLKDPTTHCAKRGLSPSIKLINQISKDTSRLEEEPDEEIDGFGF